MIDYAKKIRERFIADTRPYRFDGIPTPGDLAAKVTALRWEMHRQKRALVGEEVLAKAWNLKPFIYKR